MKINKKQLETIKKGVKAYDEMWGENYKDMCIIWEDTEDTFEFLECNYSIIIDIKNMTIEYDGIGSIKMTEKSLLRLVEEWQEFLDKE